MLAERQEDQERRIFAANLPLWFELYGGGVPAEPIDDNAVYQPGSMDELETMVQEWEAAGWDRR